MLMFKDDLVILGSFEYFEYMYRYLIFLINVIFELS